jgi:hypothetical protein
METLIDKQKKNLLKKYHTLLGMLNIDNDQKLEILAQYGAESGRDLNVGDLIDLCNRLDGMLNPANAEAEAWRKRVFSSIGGWLKLTGREGSGELIKAIACRATGYATFNEIPTSRLANVYYAFKRKAADYQRVSSITEAHIESSASMN